MRVPDPISGAFGAGCTPGTGWLYPGRPLVYGRTPMFEAAIPPTLAPVRRRLPLRFELAIVFVLACALLVPGIWRYSLVDPWESHYGEVARRMLQDHDYVHLDWQNEGFRSKPVLTFWLMATSMRAMGIGADGGYSGEMTDSRLVVLAIRLPFVLLAVMGLTLLWWMLARLVNRRAAWLAFLTVGTAPFFFFIARQGITDMTLVALMLGAISVFLLAVEDGDDPITPLFRLPYPLVQGGRLRRAWFPVTGRTVFTALVGGFILIQALYYFSYFQISRFPVTRVARLPQPGFWFVGLMSLGLLYVLWPRALSNAKAGLYYPFVVLAARDNTWRRALELGALSWFVWPVAVLLLPWVAIFSTAPLWPTAFGIARKLTDLAPIRRTSQIYMLWFWAFVGISVLGKGLPGFGLAGVCCAIYVLFQWKWRALYHGLFEVKRGLVVLLLTVLPWHIAMWLRDGPRFIQDWVFTHNLNRAAVGVHGDRGTFDYCLGQLGYGMFLWAGLVPMALAAAALVPAANPRAQRVRFMIGIWAIAATALFSLSQTKFHHYIFPAIPALSILIGLYLDDLLAGRVKPSLVLGAFGAGVVLLLARDMMHEEKQWIEMFIYRYDRPWPSMAPWSIDTSDAFLVMGLAGAGAVFLIGTRLRRLAVIAIAAAALGSALWAMHVYMPIAGTHWGMRDAVRRYYQERTVYGQKLVYYSPRSFHDDWHDRRDQWDVETFIPDAFQDGQPMSVSIEVQGLANELRFTLEGTGHVVGDSTIRIDLPPAEVAKVREQAKKYQAGRYGRRPTRVVDADRLIAWQLYWRGENFWSGDEIWGPLPELKTALKETDNVAMLRYLNDRTLAPEGRRIFVVTESGRTGSLKGIIPTQTGRDTYVILDTTSNKFSLAAFQL